MTKIPQYLYDRVSDFFGRNEERTRIWWDTPNPNLGGISPTVMIQLGREHKLRRWIDQQLSDGERD